MQNEELITKWYYIPEALLRRIRGPALVDPDDLLQAGRLGLVKAALKFDRRKGEFSTYAYFACWSQMLELLERERKARQGWGSDYALDEIPDYRAIPEPDPDYKPLYRAMNRLPARLQKILHWRFWAGLTMQQIGEMLHICKERVRQLQVQALKKLRAILMAPEYAVA
jgi:RNA polymerase sigma-B factor